MADARVTWKSGRYSVAGGWVGNVELFQLSQSTTRGDDRYELRCSLPGMKMHHTAADKAAAKVAAEELLSKFVERLGLTWKEPV